MAMAVTGGDDFVGRPNIQRAQAEFNRLRPVGDANEEFRTAKIAQACSNCWTSF
jgi:hypothetical protein